MWLIEPRTHPSLVTRPACALNNAAYWRNRAEEVRTIAETLENAQSKEILLGIANDYERMARLADERMKHKTKSS